ncbi:NAD(P)-dependent oxidoreductase [Haloarchaeobius baliensis]|uniref:NAD(P)-dependent oxidoreductase n=1 Tax=Haloarchaeobius baliensis TaxID=1670458 RepID=UPI003F8815B1
MKLAVFGATGRTGVPLCEQALERGHSVVAHTRSPEKLAFEHDRLTVVVGDAYSGEGVRETVTGADAVVSVLGQTADGPDDLLTVAGDNIVAAMTDAGVSRLVTLVGAGVRTEGESVPLSGRVVGTMLKLLARSVLEDARAHVSRVRRSDLDWTVLRAPRLTDGRGTGSYSVGDIDLGFASVARADVATCILDIVDDGLYIHELPKVGPS